MAKPAEVKRKSEAALQRGAQVAVAWITVEATGDAVVSRESVRSPSEREDVERAARAARGVTTVDNRVVVAGV